ncbi:MAG: ADP-ribosylglycohydrolase family protein [Myxococcales bacterium]|nr:ADP-ribosylglycohydrolase family protein [Myxococcales bacterium]
MQGDELERLLAVAIDAAVSAGRRIRTEFHRRGGPVGERGKAPVDERCEREIRVRLREALPTAGFLGEELGYAGPVPWPEAVWVVDPHDGTAAFLRGWRGSTVSIALVHAGRPVLGVVFAPCAPDDDGDLFAWREGGALRRNGAAVERAKLPEALAPDVLIAVSQDADRKPEINELCVRPARYRTVPSIAYRLALCAAGDVDGAVSIAGVTWWDIAAGHALLRAVGGEVIDSEGRPIVYEGERRTTDVFGGSVALARALSKAPYDRVREEREPSALERKYPRAGRSVGRAIRDADVLSRAQGCWLGQLSGDSLGSLVEFLDAGTIAYTHPRGVRALVDGGTWKTLAGQPTDDSEMALALARTLVSRGEFQTESVFEAYRDWMESGPFDIGNTTRGALSGQLSPSSQANGSLMRASPLALWNLSLDEHARDAIARRDATLTHPHSNCRDATAVFVYAVHRAIAEGLDRESLFESALEYARTRCEGTDVHAWLTKARTSPPAEFVHQMGWVAIALQNAFYRLLHSDSFEAGVIDTVACGGDTDTNAAIAGALLGAVYGREAVPRAWRRAILGCRPIAGAAGVHQPRPAPFWPADALELAEALALGPVSAG